MQRLTKAEYGILLALSASARSEDPYLQVGAAIENHEGRIIALGYNGVREGVTLDFTDRAARKPFMLHAEVNALSLIKRKEGKILYCTNSPCMSCAQAITANGIEEVVFMEVYKDDSYKKIFDLYKIKYRQLTTEEKENIYSCLRSFKA